MQPREEPGFLVMIFRSEASAYGSGRGKAPAQLAGGALLGETRQCCVVQDTPQLLVQCCVVQDTAVLLPQRCVVQDTAVLLDQCCVVQDKTVLLDQCRVVQE